MSRFYDTIFADQDVETLVGDLDPEQVAILESVIADRRDAMAGPDGDLSNETYEYIIARTHSPWVLFISARLELRLGKRDGARRFLRAALEHADSRVRLWSWRNLRALGEEIPADRARSVLGVVIETPAGVGVDLLAAYDDDTARLLTLAGDAVVSGAEDKKIAPLVRSTIDSAFLDGDSQEGHSEAMLGVDQARISVLTPAGTNVWCGSSDVSEPARALLEKAMVLRGALEDVLAAL